MVIAATGVLHHPRYPDIDGIDNFAGAVFHSARWDPDVQLDGARIGIIGTGSTAVQMVTAVVDRVDRLSLFQRTAQWVMPQENPAYPDERREAWRDDPDGLARTRQELSDMFDLFSNAVVDVESAEIKMIEQACLANLEDNVHDPLLRESLRPDYRAACKRLIISPDFYDGDPDARMPNWSPMPSSGSRRTVSAPGTAGSTNSTSSSWPPGSRPTPSCDRWRSSGGTAITLDRGLDPAPGGLPLDLDPRLPQLLHAERPERSGRELLADRGGRAPVRLHHATGRTSPVGRVPRGLRHP